MTPAPKESLTISSFGGKILVFFKVQLTMLQWVSSCYEYVSSTLWAAQLGLNRF